MSDANRRALQLHRRLTFPGRRGLVELFGAVLGEREPPLRVTGGPAVSRSRSGGATLSPTQTPCRQGGKSTPWAEDWPSPADSCSTPVTGTTPARTQSCETAAGEPLRPAGSVRTFPYAVHLPVRPWLPRSQGFPRESDAVPMAAPRRHAATSVVVRRRRRSIRHVSENLESWLAWREAGERPVPGYVEDELRGYLECGLLCFGFARGSAASHPPPLRLGPQPPRAPPRVRDRRRLRAGCCPCGL